LHPWYGVGIVFWGIDGKRIGAPVWKTYPVDRAFREKTNWRHEESDWVHVPEGAAYCAVTLGGNNSLTTHPIQIPCLQGKEAE
jgi:hypothetical protein